ncbi:MAG: L,D-transpeptidase family protein [Luteolibacter sp.]
MKYLSAFAVSLLLASCYGPTGSNYMAGIGGSQIQQTSGNTKHPEPAIPDDVSYWDGDGVSGSPLIRISLKEQKAYFYKDNTLVGISRISTGTEGHATHPGTFKITEKSKNHKSSLYGVIKDKATGETVNDNADFRVDKVGPGQVKYHAPMPNFMRFDGGIGMHTGFLPGYAASHGCVRMPHHMSEKFFENVSVGTPVIVE